MRKMTVTAMLCVSALLLSAGPVSAQLGGLKKKAEDKVKKEAEKKVDTPSETPATPQGETGKDQASQSQEAAGAEPGSGPWLNYDFVPGNRVIFYDDLTAEQVGNFPRRFEFGEGNMEVADWDKTRWLRASTRSRFSIGLPETLPEKFTIEFDFFAPPGYNSIGISGEDPEFSGSQSVEQAQIYLDITNRQAGLRNLKAATPIAMGAIDDAVFSRPMHCRVLADGGYMKVYINEKRLANVPKCTFPRADKLYFDIAANDDRPLLLANFRVASSDKTIYDALLDSGRVATQGILFDSGSDRLRPESTPTLKEIGKMLTDHADLKLIIEGHTDNTGDDASNQSLSELRANAVRDYLIAEFEIDESRLQAKGYGESHPVASNDTPEGRQSNRRSELVKL